MIDVLVEVAKLVLKYGPEVVHAVLNAVRDGKLDKEAMMANLAPYLTGAQAADLEKALNDPELDALYEKAKDVLGR